MSFLLILAEVRPTDVWDTPDVLGAILLAAIAVGTVIVLRVIRRR